MTWGFLARMKLEEYGWVDAMPGFRELLKDEHRETYNQAQPTSRTVKSKQDVIMLSVRPVCTVSASTDCD